MRSENQKVIIDTLSEEIYNYGIKCAAEQRAPARDPDASDDFIKDSKSMVRQLKQIRDTLEDLFIGML